MVNLPCTTIISAIFPFAFNSAADGIGSNNPDLQNNYNVKEDDNAEYLQLKFDVVPKLQAIGGVRIENTYMTYATQSPLTVTERSGTISYTDVLPSLHLKYSLTDDQNLRASYFASISRLVLAKLFRIKLRVSITTR